MTGPELEHSGCVREERRARNGRIFKSLISRIIQEKE
jgi:hypothetical protein